MGLFSTLVKVVVAVDKAVNKTAVKVLSNNPKLYAKAKSVLPTKEKSIVSWNEQLPDALDKAKAKAAEKINNQTQEAQAAVKSLSSTTSTIPLWLIIGAPILLIVSVAAFIKLRK